MPLTPEEVRNKEFTTVRLREGYDEEEVDAFLDEVEVELTRLYRENDDLRAQLEAVHRGGPVPMRAEADKPVMPMGGPGGGSDSATRILALAQRTADELVAEARAEADKALGEARAKVEAAEREARAKSEALQREARVKAETLERDAREKHREAMGSLENERGQLERKVEGLQAFEREYRSRLKSYLEGQLRELDGRVADGPGPRAPQPAPAHQGRGGGPYGGPGADNPMAARGFLLEDDAEPHRG